MKKEIEVPEIGESVSSGILASWLKEDGERVDEGEEIFELETDKATLGVPSPAAGVLSRGAAEGDEVAVGQVVGQIDTDGAAGGPAKGGEQKSEQPASDGGTQPKSENATAKRETTTEAPAGAGSASPTSPGGAGGQRHASTASDSLSPAVRRVVAEHGLDASKITGTGPGGRVTKADAEKAAKAKEAGGATGGRPPALGEPSMQENERQRRVPLSNLRRRIAENLVHSRQSSAHVTTFNEVDMSAVMGVRAKYKDTFSEQHGVRLGFMSFFVKAAQYALQAFPEVNAYLDGTDVLYNDYVNIGVALSSDKGLLTPVLKDVEMKGFADIEGQIVDFSERARSKRLKPDEMVGATFTISNGGIFGSLLSTPIPSPPQTAVMGMHTIQKRPIAVGDEVVIRPMMYLALTYDHRMIDGREAVLFLGRIKELVEDPTRLLLGI